MQFWEPRCDCIAEDEDDCICDIKETYDNCCECNFCISYVNCNGRLPGGASPPQNFPTRQNDDESDNSPPQNFPTYHDDDNDE
jgi:hypothetical protein